MSALHARKGPEPRDRRLPRNDERRSLRARPLARNAGSGLELKSYRLGAWDSDFAGGSTESRDSRGRTARAFEPSRHGLRRGAPLQRGVTVAEDRAALEGRRAAPTATPLWRVGRDPSDRREAAQWSCGAARSDAVYEVLGRIPMPMNQPREP